MNQHFSQLGFFPFDSSVMGVFTSNNKRGNDYWVKDDIHISKKLKVSASANQTALSNIRVASPISSAPRIPQYPDIKSVFLRVHAPVRNSRYLCCSGKGIAAIVVSQKRPADVIGSGRFNDLSPKYNNAGAKAFRSLKYVGKKKEKAVIELDSGNDSRYNISDDSSVEKVNTENFEQWAAVSSDEGTNAKNIDKEVRSLESSVVTYEGDINAKEDVAEDMERMKLERVSDDSSVPYYKRLIDKITKIRDPKLISLNLGIKSNENFIQRIRSLWPWKKEKKIEKDVAEECFVPLTKEEEIEVSKTLSISNRGKLLVTHQNSNIDISVEKLQCLRPGGWLNDEVINLYLELLKEREKREPNKFLKCHFFNTFFYKKLINGKGGYNFQSVKRWTTQRKVGYSLLECQKIFVPIHKDIHWCLAIINKKEKKFQYLDSLRGVDSRVLDVLARYYVDEVKDKSGKEINVSSWEHEFVEDLPDQENGYDCGVFMIKYADFHSRDIGLCFSQEHMPYFRRRTAKEILKLRAD